MLLGVEYGDLGSALGRLSPQMRAVVQATVLDGLTTLEAARLLGIPQNTVKTRLHRAKAHLRENLNENLNEKMAEATRPGADRGNRMRIIAPILLHPSTIACSSSSGGMLRKYPISIQVQKGTVNER